MGAAYAGVARIEVGADRLAPDFGPTCPSIRLQRGRFLLGDPLAGEGCSERPRVSSEMPLSEPLAPRGMSSGIGLGRGFRHRRAQTTSTRLRKVNFRLSPAPPVL